MPEPSPPTDSSHQEDRVPAGVVFLILILVSIALWVVLIAFVT